MNTLNATIKWTRFFALAGLVCLSVTSCNLLPDDEDNNASAQPAPPTPTISDGYATLSAVKTVTFQDIPGFGQIEVDFGIAVGVFFNGVDYNTYLNAGTVTCESETLEEQDNGSYVFIPSQTSASGIDFSGNPDWNVTGSADVSAFSHTTSIGFPTVGTINSSSTVSSGSDYTLTVASVTGADSVIFMMGGVVHTEAGNATSSTFTSAEISGMGTGTNFAQAAAYKIEEATYGAKNYWFVNEKVVTQSITIE
ncbi:hypothetical protein OAE48_04240 [Flavobacteriales bacterium]|nr:hypothetical protein [Flavobacteriales bacterium]